MEDESTGIPIDVMQPAPDEHFRMHIHPGYVRVGDYFQVQNGQQIDIHYRAVRDGEEPRELIAYSNVPPSDVAELLEAGNNKAAALTGDSSD